MLIGMNNIGRLIVSLIFVISLFVTVVEAQESGVIETDLGVVHYTQAPKTWTINVPQNFSKVEVAHYSSGKIEANKYMGWNGYLKLNGQYVWEFVRFDATLGGIIYDYIAGMEVRESTGRGMWLDVTSRINVGSNTITYYHYTEGDGIGVKVRIYTTTTTPTPTPTPSPTPAPTITAVPITSASISLYGISSSYYAGDTLTTTVYVKNTGKTSHTFPVGFSVRDPEGTWGDVPYKTATLSPGADTNIYFEYKIPAAGPAGTWTARAAVWDRDAGGGILETRYDYYDKSFSVSIPATPVPTTTITPTPVETIAKPSASVELHGEKTDVIIGEDIILKLSAVNIIPNPEMTLQVILIPPSGMSIISSDFVSSGAGQYTSMYKIETGRGRDIEVRIKSNQVGIFDVKGRIVYYYGDNTSTKEDYTLTLPIKVRPGAESTESKQVSREGETPKTPGFVSVMAIVSILATAHMFRGNKERR